MEHQGPDAGGHANDLAEVVASTLEFEQAVQTVLTWATGRLDTLIVVVSDHETGGLVITEQNPIAGVLPAHTYTSTDHTGVSIPIYAWGFDSAYVDGVLDNTELFPLLGGVADLPRTVAVFRQGVDGYSSASDTWLSEAQPAVAHGGDLQLDVDADEPSGSGQQEQALLRFGDVVGNGPGQIPAGSEIVSARLILEVTDEGSGLCVHEMLEAWSDADTWTSFGGDGVQAGTEAASSPVASTASLIVGTALIDVTASVQSWLGDPSSNYGWVLLSSGTGGVKVDSAEGAAAPRLQVVYR